MVQTVDKPIMTEKEKKVIAGCAIAVFVLFSAAVAWFVGRPMLHFARQPELFRAWVASHGIWGKLAYVGMVVLQVLVAIIPGEPLEISGGYAFGAMWGTILCLTGAVLGSLLVFAFVRRWGVALVEVFFSHEKLQSLRFLQSSPKRNALFWLIFTVPGTPKDLLCYFAGLTDLSWRKWLLICTLGRIPSIITSTVGGSALGTSDYHFALLVFSLTLLISGIGWLIYRVICRKNEQTTQS